MNNPDPLGRSILRDFWRLYSVLTYESRVAAIQQQLREAAARDYPNKEPMPTFSDIVQRLATEHAGNTVDYSDALLKDWEAVEKCFNARGWRPEQIVQFKATCERVSAARDHLLGEAA